MYKRISLVFLLILMLFTLTACGGPESTYKSAQGLLSKGKYAEAAAKFESIGSYEDASTLTMYCKACALCESNDFEAGLAAFEMLGNFKDCSYRITYYEAREYEHEAGTTNWEYMLEAYDIYQQIPVFLDSADRSAALIENVYNLAIKAGESKEYPDTWDNPLNALYQLSEYKYKDSDKRITYYQIMFAEQYALEDNNAFWLLNVAERYAELGDYLDCEKRATAAEKKANEILDDAYKAAAALKRDGKYEEAIAAFKAIESHRDSAEQIKSCEIVILDGKYAVAEALKIEGKYEEAIAAFKEIKTHKDSIAQIKACETAILDSKYEAAIALLNEGKYLEAYEAFVSLNGHKDSSAKAESIHNKAMSEKLAKATVGSYITFGTYEQDNNTSNGKEDIEWLVLGKENNHLLVISRYALDCKPYNKEYTSVTWETCTLRKWLNNDFLNAAFSSTEKNMIPTVTVSADKNPDYSTSPGNATQDKVFLLSIPEVNKYFASDSARKCKPTAYAKKQEVYTGSSVFCWWWLRSPCLYQNSAAFVYSDGDVFEYGRAVIGGGIAVRPALWVNLEP